jgi:hypothetical protein
MKKGSDPFSLADNGVGSLIVRTASIDPEKGI